MSLFYFIWQILNNRSKIDKVWFFMYVIPALNLLMTVFIVEKHATHMSHFIYDIKSYKIPSVRRDTRYHEDYFESEWQVGLPVCFNCWSRKLIIENKHLAFHNVRGQCNISHALNSSRDPVLVRLSRFLSRAGNYPSPNPCMTMWNHTQKSC